MRKITIGNWEFEPISREGTVREKEYRDLYTRNGQPDTVALVFSCLRSTPFDCVTLNLNSK